MQEGHGDEALLLVWSDSLEVARWRWVTAGEAVADAEQSSEEAGPNGGREERSQWQLPQ
jgi:hypothetical protein